MLAEISVSTVRRQNIFHLSEHLPLSEQLPHLPEQLSPPVRTAASTCQKTEHLLPPVRTAVPTCQNSCPHLSEQLPLHVRTAALTCQNSFPCLSEQLPSPVRTAPPPPPPPPIRTAAITCQNSSPLPVRTLPSPVRTDFPACQNICPHLSEQLSLPVRKSVHMSEQLSVSLHFLPVRTAVRACQNNVTCGCDFCQISNLCMSCLQMQCVKPFLTYLFVSCMPH